MNRNNFLPHLALALVLIFVAAFAGQLRKWQKDWKANVRIFPAKSKTELWKDDQAVRHEPNTLAVPEVLVKFRSDVNEEAIQRITASFNDTVEDEIEAVPGLQAIDDLDDAEAAAVVAQYQALPEVEYAEENYEISLEEPGEVSFASSEPGYSESDEHLHPQDPLFSEQWALDNHGQSGGKEGADISAARAWSITSGSDQVVVAVIDTGVDYTHTDLANNIWVRPASIPAYEDRQIGTIQDFHGYNAVENNADPMDDSGHGTHCAGIIGAEGGNNLGIAGVNWKVQIMPLKFMNAGGFGNTKDAIESINYVIDRRNKGVNVRVISASWGSTRKSRALEEVIRKAYDAGIIFVAASGNASTNTDRTPHYPSSYKLPNLISVAALDRNDQLASFSNFGEKSVHIAAPGKDILSTWLGDNYEAHSGTSMATPVVAGVAALLLSREPALSVEELRRRLFASVDKLDSLKAKVV
ncbi:MAG TPA: S8 family serine peptidase, partial [Pyrinomonadaceae bacterium]|nr:S8 family serine peptidase [Pyrinomonadaceae bacterium]